MSTNAVKSDIVIFLSGLFMTFFTIGFSIAIFMQVYRFNVDIGDYLKRAADAPSIDMAVVALDTAIENIERRELTSGSSAFFLHKPSTDVGYWYEQLVNTRSELLDAQQDGSQLVSSNALMKLREVLLDGDELTLPNNITLFPNQRLWIFFAAVSVIFIIFGPAIIVDYIAKST